MEAAWRLQEFPIGCRGQSVVRLAVHTENQRQIIFQDINSAAALNNWKTTLTAWFDLDEIDDFPKNINYINIPQYSVFNNQSNAWVRRKRNQQVNTINRMSIVSPKDSERFYLKLILHKITGVTCFEDLLTVDKIFYKTLKEAALALGLIEDDVHISKVIDEVCKIMLPYQLF